MQYPFRIVIPTAHLYLSPHSFCRICAQILCQVCDGIALDLHAGSAVREAGGGSRIYTRCVVNKIRGEGRVLDLRILQIPGQLMDDGANHFQMPQFFCT